MSGGDADVLRLEDVHVALGGRPVLRGLHARVPPGGVLVVMGRSGAGKTTLLRVAAGLLAPASGRRAVASERIGYAFQEPRLLPWRTVRQNVVFALGRRAGARDRARADALLADVGLEEVGDAYPAVLSGGMRQRVGIARALMADPPLLLLDEPLNGLDARHREELGRRIVSTLSARGAGAVWTTHDPREAARLADEILVLPAGPDGAPRALRPSVPRGSRDDADIGRLAHHLTPL